LKLVKIRRSVDYGPTCSQCIDKPTPEKCKTKNMLLKGVNVLFVTQQWSC